MTLRNFFSRKWLCAWLATAGMFASQAVSFAGEPACNTSTCEASTCEPGCGCGDEDPFTLMGLFHDDCDEPAFTVGGWTQWGYYSETNGMFFDNDNKGFKNHQSWLFIERVADGSEGLGFGFRADLMYGQDADDTQAFGNNPGEWDYLHGYDRGFGYGWAMPQLYGEVAMGDLSIKAGHFYTLLGYEVVTAPDNFFFSHAYTMFNSEAFTHTGALATYNASDNLTLYGGWTLGWDTGFDQNNGGSSFLGGFSVGLSDDAKFTYITTAGDFGLIGEGYSHSTVLDLTLSENLNYVIQSDLLDIRDSAAGVNTETIGLNQYLFYTLTDKTAVGGRAEWWKRDGISHYAVTGGINIKPTGNLIIRPEIRHDWAPAGNTVDPDGKSNFTTVAADVILTF